MAQKATTAAKETKSKSNRRASNGMGSISQRADGRWMGRVSLPGGTRKYVYGDTEPEVVERVQELLNKKRLGLPVRSDERLTVEVYLNSWLATKKVRPATHKQYEVSIRVHLNPRLGDYRLVKLTPQNLRQWIADKEAEGKVSASTIRLALATLKTALSQAVTDELVPRNVAKLVKPPQPSQEFEAQFLTQEQAKAFLACLREYRDRYGHMCTHRMYAFYSVALALGLRKGEALALSWQDLDFEHGKLAVRATLQRIDGKLVRSEPKTRESRRTIVLPKGLVETLRAHRDRQQFERKRATEGGKGGGDTWTGNQWDLIFVTERGTPLEPRNINRQLTVLLKKAGLDHIRMHDCRHTACALLLSQGIPVHVVSKILGHANPAITLKVYAKVLPSQQDEAALAMNNLLFGS